MPNFAHFFPNSKRLQIVQNERKYPKTKKLNLKKKISLKQFRNFDPKPKGGPQASLALAKGGPKENFQKLEKCFKPFETLQKSFKTISLIKIFTLDE